MISTLGQQFHTDDTRLRFLGTAAALLLAVMFPVGIAGMLGGMLGSAYLWTTSVFLGVQAVLTFILLWDASSFVRAAFIAVALGAASVGVEFIGLATGVPFGSYYYSYYLEPFVVSNVPLAIVFAWFVLVVNTVLVARGGTLGTIATIVGGGVLILGIDIMLEPYASFVNRYWTWAGGVIPIQNYASWFVIGMLLIAAVHRSMPATASGRRAARGRLPDAILGMTAVQCAIINTWNGYWEATAVGAILIAVSYWRLTRGSV